MQESFYEEYAQVEASHWWFRGRRAIFDVIIRSLSLAPGARLLDLGCGTGSNLRFLGAYGHVVGLDRGEAATLHCRATTTAPVLRGDVTQIPCATGSFDLVTAFDLIEHVDDDKSCVRELARVCRPGGFVLLTVPAFSWLWGAQDVISHHKRRYRSGELVDLLATQGLEIQRSTYLNTLLFPIVAAVRLWRRVRPPASAEVRSDFTMTKPGPMNDLLARVFGLEAQAIRWGRLPFGVSLLLLARKPAAV